MTMTKGFTLVEMLVAMTAFLIIIGAISGLFIFGIREQQRSLTTQAILNQTSYALEYMGRALRMAGKEFNAPTCLSQNGLNYEHFDGGKSGIKFINVLEGRDCQAFFLQNGQLKYRKKIGQPGEVTFDLTSDKLEITSLNFNLIGQSQFDNLQPRVTVSLEIKDRRADQPRVKIQTTISQRKLDVRY